MRRGKQTQRMSQIPRVSCKPVNRIVMSVDFGCTFNRIRETILRKSWSPKLGRGGGGFTERKYSTIYIQWVLPIHFAVCLERYDGNMAIWLYGLWSKRGDWWLSGLDTRGTKTQNFPGSNFLRAKTFRTKCAKPFLTTSLKSALLPLTTLPKNA